MAASSRKPHPRTPPPQQARSAETLESVLDAAESLLRRRPLDGVSIAEIADRAGVGVGTVYTRFPSKDSILLALYERYDRSLHESVERLVASGALRGGTLRETARRHIASTVAYLREHKWLVREAALLARRRPGSINAEVRARRVALIDRWREPFLEHRHRIAHADPDSAVTFALFLVTAAARELVLFDDAPYARAVRRSDERLIEHLTAALCGYLTTSPVEPVPETSP